MGSVLLCSMFFHQAISERAENSDKLKTRAEATSPTTPRPACYSIDVKGCSSNVYASGGAQLNIDGLQSLLRENSHGRLTHLEYDFTTSTMGRIVLISHFCLNSG